MGDILIGGRKLRSPILHSGIIFSIEHLINFLRPAAKKYTPIKSSIGKGWYTGTVLA